MTLQIALLRRQRGHLFVNSSFKKSLFDQLDRSGVEATLAFFFQTFRVVQGDVGQETQARMEATS
jgi:hypothetical protein